MVALFSIHLFLLICSCQAYLNYIPSTEVCSNATKMGTDQCCPCSGQCTTSEPFLSNWGWGCDDMGTEPVCGPSQVYFPGDYPYGKVQVPTGGPCCSVCGDDCKWTNWKYTYKCCDCPAGYISSADKHNCRSLYCVGCTGPQEKLIGDSATGFKCVAAPAVSSLRTSASSSTSRSRSASSSSSVSSTSSSQSSSSSKFSSKSSSSSRSSSSAQSSASSVSSKSASSQRQTSQPASNLNTARPETTSSLPPLGTNNKATSISRPPIASPVNGECKLNPAGETFIKSFEKYSQWFYDAGDDDQTIGWGHDCTKNNDCASFNPPLKKVPDGDNLFTKDISKYSKALRRNLPNMDGLNENQLAALVSFTYNCGGESGRKIKKYWLTYMQSKDFAGICKALPTTCVPKNPKISRGVARRRSGEAELCSKPTTTMSGC